MKELFLENDVITSEMDSIIGGFSIKYKKKKIQKTGDTTTETTTTITINS